MPSLILGGVNSPVVWLLATLVAYRLALAIYMRCNSSPLLHPVSVSTAVLVILLAVLKVDYAAYQEGAKFIHFLLGPATVALAVPLYAQIDKIRRNWVSLTVGALAGSLVAVATAMGVASLLGATRETILSIGVKSVTMPIAIGLAEKIGGIPSLASALVMLTGVLGAATSQRILKAMRITDPDTVGFTLGVVAHGIGASRALQVNREMGAFAGLAMGLAGAVTAFLLPLCLKAFGYV